MDEIFQDNLLRLKKAFVGSETQEVAKRIFDHFENREVRFLHILDIGTGRGETLQKIVGRLDICGIKVTVTGIDVHRPRSMVFGSDPSFTFIKTPFDAFSTTRKFDLVISTHSLYYLGQTVATLEKMIEIVAPSGLLVLALWSRECVLYHLHKSVFGSEGLCTVCAEEVADMLAGSGKVSYVGLSMYRGDFDKSRITDSEESLRAAAHIVSRQSLQPGWEKVRAFHEALISMPDSAKRVVGTVFVAR